jgi:hypothetical protein
MKILFFAEATKPTEKIWGVYWQEPGKVVGKVLDPKGEIFDKDYPGYKLKDLYKESGHYAQPYCVDMDKKAALDLLGKKKDLLDKHKQIDL